MKFMKIMKKERLTLKYLNEKRLGVHDFIESIKTDLLYNISKNRGFIDEERKIIYFEIWHTDNNNDKWFLSFFNGIKKFDEGDICTDKFARDLLDYANHYYSIWLDIVDVEDYKIEHSINDFIIISFKVTLYIDSYKISHKKKFYKDLYDDLMSVAWHPSRYLEWCVDIEELKFLKELWGED